MSQPQQTARCTESAHILENSGAEDLIVDNSDERHVAEVTREVLSSANWL
ncbi:MAG: hypothetical protein QGI09_05510 [Dehalococcoidia bacterium]|jgi:hypothetical protein|nr:hypothetical protein [Dehalococcoidia bacterium]